MAVVTRRPRSDQQVRCRRWRSQLVRSCPRTFHGMSSGRRINVSLDSTCSFVRVVVSVGMARGVGERLLRAMCEVHVAGGTVRGCGQDGVRIGPTSMPGFTKPETRNDLHVSGSSQSVWKVVLSVAVDASTFRFSDWNSSSVRNPRSRRSANLCSWSAVLEVPAGCCTYWSNALRCSAACAAARSCIDPPLKMRYAKTPRKGRRTTKTTQSILAAPPRS